MPKQFRQMVTRFRYNGTRVVQVTIMDAFPRQRPRVSFGWAAVAMTTLLSCTGNIEAGPGSGSGGSKGKGQTGTGSSPGSSGSGGTGGGMAGTGSSQGSSGSVGTS